ncbi:MAG: type IV secretory system conjugative DNA transfer family protein [Candidatus Paceibacterota bacterium]
MSVYISLFISLVGTTVVGVVAFFILRAIARKKLAERLHLRLFLVRLPLVDKEGKELKKEIGVMEQLLSALAAFGKYFVFEMAVPAVGQEIHFYVSVPASAREMLVRQVQALWRDADVSEAEDYTIFNYTGAVAGASLKQKEAYALPIRTYQEFDADPFLSILGGLTHINEVGEGCAIQIVVQPSSGSDKKVIRNAIGGLKKGQKLHSTIKGPSFSFSDVVNAVNPKGDDKKYEEKVIDEAAIKALEMKVGKPLFKVNVRVVASAPSQYQADAIADGVTAGFSQFASPERNEFKIIKPKRLQDFIQAFTFRAFEEEDAMILNSEEIASIFHFPTPFTEMPRLRYLKSREAPPPSQLSREGISIGESRYRGGHIKIKLAREDRRRHLYVVGQTGTGKSVFINNCVGQDMKNGEGVCVIDPNGDLFEDILKRVPKERMKDVIVFDPSDLSYPLGMNMLEYDARFPEQKTFIINELMMIFDTLYDLKATGGPLFEQYARNALLLLMDDPADGFTILEIPRVLSDAEFRKKLLVKCKNILAKDFWEKEAEKAGGEAALANMVPYISSKFNTFIANDYVRPIIAQSKSSLDFRKIMDEGKILVVNLSKGRIGELNASLLGMILVGKLTIAAFSRADIPMEKRKDFYLYIDEFQNFTTPGISTILSEARKYRLCLTVAHQFISQLKEPIRDAIFGNVGSMVAFRVGADDAEFLAKQFAPVFGASDIMNIDNLNAHIKILINNQVYPPFNIFVPFPLQGSEELIELAREHTRQIYGRPRNEVEEEIYKRLKAVS